MTNSIFSVLAQDTTDRIPAPEYQYGSYWFPQQASSFAADLDFMFYAILWISTIFFIGIVVAMTYFAIKYRRRPGHAVEKSPSHNTALELAWSILPGFLLIWFFIEGANGYFETRMIPSDAEQITVVARQFSWEFHYPDGDISTELHLVVNEPTEFLLDSRDVLHSFFVPAFRQKQDVVPGRYRKTWVRPTKVGQFRVYCAEYCGDNHSNMVTNVTVHLTEEERKAATRWEWGEKSPIENGERLFKLKCAGCHSSGDRQDKSLQKTGPNLGGIWGIEETMVSGPPRTVDENYFRESVENPNAAIVSGFRSPSEMTPFLGQINGDQMLWLMAYIKSLSGVVEEPSTTDDKGDDSADNGAEVDKSGSASKSDN